MKDKKSIKRLLVLAILAGKIMLKNGAETYRVEDTIIRICKSRGIRFAQAFVTPTGIFLSVEYGDDIFSYIQRVKSIEIDLEKIALVNEISRNVVDKNIDLEDAYIELSQADKSKKYSKSIKYLIGSFSGGFYPLLIGATFKEFIGAIIVTLLVIISIDYISKLKITFFINNILGGIVATIFSIIFVKIFKNADINKIIIGSIMPLVPGVAITNAVRDSISGELVSGISRTMEAIIIASAIAFGVGISLKIYFSYGGI